MDAVTCPAPFTLAFDPAVRDQVGDCGVPLAIRYASGGEDLPGSTVRHASI